MKKTSGADTTQSNGRRPARKAGAKSDAIASDAISSDAISIGLQQLFASIVEEPVPDDFLALLDQIEAKEQALAQAPNGGTQTVQGAGEMPDSGEASQ